MKKIIYAFITLLTGAFATFAQQQGSIKFYPEVTWLPGGKYLSFTMVSGTGPKDFHSDIYTIKADGTDLKKITGDDKNEFGASWAKNGKRVLFSAGVKGDMTNSALYFAKRDGSEPVQLVAASQRMIQPELSPDGKKIIYVSFNDNKKAQIFVMNSDGTDSRRLTMDSSISYFNPNWSPDGKRLVYYAEKGDQKDQVWMMNADGTNQTLLTNNTGHNVFPAWAPDGKKIIFSSDRDGERETLYTVNPDGTGFTKIPNLKGGMARFSPDGKKIVFISSKPPQPNSPPESFIYIANADGSGITKLVGN